MMSAIEIYLRRVKDLLASVRNILTDAEAMEVQHLIDHDECPEALRTLAWIIVEEDKRVSRQTVESIRSLTIERIDAEHVPANLEEFISD